MKMHIHSYSKKTTNCTINLFCSYAITYFLFLLFRFWNILTTCSNWNRTSPSKDPDVLFRKLPKKCWKRKKRKRKYWMQSVLRTPSVMMGWTETVSKGSHSSAYRSLHKVLHPYFIQGLPTLTLVWCVMLISGWFIVMKRCAIVFSYFNGYVFVSSLNME